MKKILLFLADGFEEIEALTVVDVLRRANVHVDTCSLEGEMVRGTHDVYVKADIQLSGQLGEYDGICLPGGMPGAQNLMEDDRVQEVIKAYDQEGKLVSAICAAPIALNRAGVLKDKRGTSFPGLEDQLDYAEYVDDPVVVSGNLLTSRGPATALSFSYAILDYLGCEKESEELKEDMLFNYVKNNL